MEMFEKSKKTLKIFSKILNKYSAFMASIHL